MKDVFIQIKGTQEAAGDRDEIEFASAGQMAVDETGVTLRYHEGELFGAADVKSELTISRDGTVVMERSGAVNTRLVIKQGQRNSCFYCTDQGELAIGIFGEEVKWDFSESGGWLDMSYTIDSNLRPISRNQVKITVKEGT